MAKGKRPETDHACSSVCIPRSWRLRIAEDERRGWSSAEQTRRQLYIASFIFGSHNHDSLLSESFRLRIATTWIYHEQEVAFTVAVSQPPLGSVKQPWPTRGCGVGTISLRENRRLGSGLLLCDDCLGLGIGPGDRLTWEILRALP